MNIRNERRMAPGYRVKADGRLVNVTIVLFVLFFFFIAPRACCLAPAVAFGAWSGVDESVVEKVAGEHGRHAREPLINTDQGDLLLFVFLLAGTVGGFAAGYYWRVLVEKKSENT